MSQWAIKRLASHGDVFGTASSWTVQPGTTLEGPIILVAEDEVDIATLPKEIEGVAVTYVAIPRPEEQ